MSVDSVVTLNVGVDTKGAEAGLKNLGNLLQGFKETIAAMNQAGIKDLGAANASSELAKVRAELTKLKSAMDTQGADYKASLDKQVLDHKAAMDKITVDLSAHLTKQVEMEVGSAKLTKEKVLQQRREMQAYTVTGNTTADISYFSASSATQREAALRVMQVDQAKAAALIGPPQSAYIKALAEQKAYEESSAASYVIAHRTMEVARQREAALIGPPESAYIKALAAQKAYEEKSTAGYIAAHRTMEVARQKEAALIGPPTSAYVKALAERKAYEESSAAGYAAAHRTMEVARQKEAALIGPPEAAYIKALAEQRAYATSSNAQREAAIRVMQIDQLKAAALIGPPTALYEAHIRNLGKSTEETHKHTEAQKALHSALRGTSGALGALWLTYGSHVPAMLAGFAAVATLRQTVKSGTEFDYTTSFTAALDDRSKQGGMQAYKEKLQSDILEVAQTTQYSANELAKGLRVLEQTGVDASKGIGLIKTASQAALMGEVDLKTATQDLIAVMTVFKMRSDDPLTLQKNFQKVGDVMATVSKETQANLHDVAESFKQVTGMSDVYKISLQTTAAVITQLGSVGITGSRAGTFTRNMYDNLYTQGSSEAQKIKKALDITPFAADGSYKKDIEYLKETFDKIRSINSEKERGIAISAIFNERGGKPARELLAAFESTAAFLTKINNSEGALAGFAKNLEGVAKIEWQAVGARWDDMLVKVFRGSEGAMSDMAKQLQKAFVDPQLQDGLKNIFQTTVLIAKVVALIGEGWARILSLKGDSKIMAEALAFRAWAEKAGVLTGVASGDISGMRAAAGRITADPKLKEVQQAQAAAAAPKAAPAGGTSLPLSITDHAAFSEQQKLAKMKADEAVKQFKEAEALALGDYKLQSDLLDRAYSKKLVSEEDYIAQRKSLEELYLFDVVTIEFEAVRKINANASTLEKESTREALEIAKRGISARITHENLAHQDARKKRLAEAAQDAQEVVKNIMTKEGPALSSRAQFDTNKLATQRNAKHFSTADRAEAEAELRVEGIFQSAISATNEKIAEATKLHGQDSASVKELTAAKGDLIARMRLAGTEAKRVALEILRSENTWQSGAQAGIQSYINDVTSMGSKVEQIMVKAFKGMEDALVNFVMTGKLDFKSLANSIISDIARIVIQQQITKPLADLGGGMLKSIFSGFSGSTSANANGNVFSSSDLAQYQNTIVSSPTLFRFAQGGAFSTGLMGEAGPEAIMPLSRGSDGKLGVQATGGAAPAVTVQIINQSGQQLGGKQQGAPKFNGEEWVLSIVVDAIGSNPQFRSALGMGR